MGLARSVRYPASIGEPKANLAIGTPSTSSHRPGDLRINVDINSLDPTYSQGRLMQINRLGFKIVENWTKSSRLTAHVFPIEGKRASPLSDLKAPSVRLRLSKTYIRGMKRKATEADTSSKAKRMKEPEPDYCDAQPQKSEDGSIIWPAPMDAMESARSFLRECATSAKRTLIVPDKDADGLDAGVIIHRTLTSLGLSPSLIEVHLLKKGASVHSEEERATMQSKDPGYVIVVDQGSRPGPPVVDSPEVKSLIIDHHLSDKFPRDALIVSACHYPPVATSALLTYEICRTLHLDVADSCGYLCAMGTHGDLGTALKWKPPFPNMTEVFKTYTKKSINDAVSLINAPRRTSKYDVESAWNALLEAKSPKEVLTNRRLLSARAEINEEVEKHTHTPPKFSKDGKIAILRIESAAQVHPVIATRWAGHLKSNSLEIVMVANSGYLPGMVNFSCRIARCARSRDPPVNIIASLKAIADLDTNDLVERMGESFARGHKEASGGIIPAPEFEELMALMKVGEKPDPPDGAIPGKTKKAQTTPQKNNLMNYFGRKPQPAVTP